MPLPWGQILVTNPHLLHDLGWVGHDNDRHIKASLVNQTLRSQGAYRLEIISARSETKPVDSLDEKDMGSSPDPFGAGAYNLQSISALRP